MTQKSNLSQIKKDIETCIGDNVQLISNAGRKKSIIKEGVLENTYANIFVVKLKDEADISRRVTYSYTDVFTNAVELFILKDDQKIKVS
jgi:uncharacterized protein Veg